MHTLIYTNEQRLIECCEKVASLKGDAAEIGVYRGYSASLICRELPDTLLHLFDTFAGMPKELYRQGDKHKPGDFSETSVVTVRDELVRQGHRNFVIHEGLFPRTAVTCPLKLVHIDCDLYESTAEALRWAWWHLVPGGLILCDDWKVAGAKQAIEEFLRIMKPAHTVLPDKVRIEKNGDAAQ